MSYLDRYLAGEHEQVWAELVELGAAVREEPLYADALAVARETMRRARHNIETLIPRLRAVGYRFGYYWMRKAERARQGNPPPLFAPAAADAAARIVALESQAGAIPLSIVAWYETIGAVNFVGCAPRSWGLRDPQAPSHWTRWRAAVGCHDTAGDDSRLRDAGLLNWERPEVVLDPLQVLTLDSQVAMFRDWREEFRTEGYQDYRFTMLIAYCAGLKYETDDTELYQIVLPKPSADTCLSGEWHQTTFVNYLRICFRWGGLPGLHMSPNPPFRDLAYLTEGLLPL